MMWNTLYKKYVQLGDEVFVFPGHGAGSPCGKSLSSDLFSTFGKERGSNPALQFKIDESGRKSFIDWLISSTTTIGFPQQFLNCVHTNIKGAEALQVTLDRLDKCNMEEFDNKNTLIIDTRIPDDFSHCHIENSINMSTGMDTSGELMTVQDGNMAIWLGTLISPDTQFLMIYPEGHKRHVIERVSRIG